MPEMTEKQFKNFKAMIESEAGNAMDALIKKEIEAGGDPQFLNGVKSSQFFRQLHANGFIKGIDWERQNKDTKFVF